MKLNNIKNTMTLALAAMSFAACSDWTEIESVNETDLNGTTKTEEDYAALRAWKETPNLPQVFVWFDNWTGISPTGENSLRGLPDSVTIASNWGGHPKFELTPERRADMEYVQKVKGTKVVVTLFSAKCGDDVEHQDIYDIGTSSDEAVIRPAIRAYAEEIYKQCIKCGYDGFDWDYEPTYGGQSTAQAPLWKVRKQCEVFIEELSYWFGNGAMDPNRDRGDRAMPERRLLFLIDGEVGIGQGLDEDWLSHYVDYYVLQAYGGGNLSGRVSGVIGDLSKWVEEGKLTKEDVVRRTILTENFESYAGTGGGFLNMSKYIHTANGINQQIGGCGLYRVGFDYNQGKGDYNGSPEYYFLRQGITNIYQIFYGRLNGNQEETEQ